MRFLLCTLEGPLMSFGGPKVDELGTTLEHPSLSLVTGLLANALGWERQQVDRLERLQDRLLLGSRIDQAGEIVVDYQTVDLGLVAGHHFYRKEKPPHIRRRFFHGDRVVTIAMALLGTGDPDLTDAELALRFPARPLMLGRASCFPSQPLVRGHVDADSPAAALAAWPRHSRSPMGPLDALVRGEGPIELTGDRRDWANSVGIGITNARLITVDPTVPAQEPAHV